MATLAELISDTYTLTGRPDLVDETKLAVKQATLKLHHSDFYPKDIHETGINWSPAAFVQSLPYKSIVPQWRAFKYLRKYADSVPGAFFTMLTPEESLDRYAINKDNICYLAGEQIEIRSSTEDEYMLLGCYVHPVLTDEGFSSWLADEHPYAVIYEAAANIFKMIGLDEQAAYMKQTVAEQLQAIKTSQITGVGY